MEEMQMVEEFNETEVAEAELCEGTSFGILGLVIGGAAAAVGGLLWATRNWRQKRRIAKLEKQGYIVTLANDADSADENCEDID